MVMPDSAGVFQACGATWPAVHSACSHSGRLAPSGRHRVHSQSIL